MILKRTFSTSKSVRTESVLLLVCVNQRMDQIVGSRQGLHLYQETLSSRNLDIGTYYLSLVWHWSVFRATDVAVSLEKNVAPAVTSRRLVLIYDAYFLCGYTECL